MHSSDKTGAWHCKLVWLMQRGLWWHVMESVERCGSAEFQAAFSLMWFWRMAGNR